MPKYELNLSIEVEASNEEEAEDKAQYIIEEVGKLPFVDYYEKIYFEELIHKSKKKVE